MRLKQQVQSLTLIPGTAGVFEVRINGELVHSKTETGEFPDPSDIVQAARERR